MDQRYKEYLKKQGKVDSVRIWDVCRLGSDVRTCADPGVFCLTMSMSEKSVCACEPWLLHARPQNHRRVWLGKDLKAYLKLISFRLLLWAGTPCTRVDCSKHTLLGHVQFVVHQHPQVLLLCAALHSPPRLHLPPSAWGCSDPGAAPVPCWPS